MNGRWTMTMDEFNKHLHVAEAEGFDIYENELASLTDAKLWGTGIDVQELRRCFAEGMKMMQGQDWAKVRPVAFPEREDCGDHLMRTGRYAVCLCGYDQERPHPMMDDPAEGSGPQ
jgi:hypothetical protein